MEELWQIVSNVEINSEMGEEPISANLNSSCWSVLQLPKSPFWITSGLPTILKVDGDKRVSQY
jgi:hypothetical protein